MKTLGILDFTNRSNVGTTHLTRKEKERLDEIGFSWGHLQRALLTNDVIDSNAFKKNSRAWNIRIGFGVRTNYEALKAVLQDSAQLNGSTLTDELERWTTEQRKLRWEMSERRQLLLDELYFDWQEGKYGYNTSASKKEEPSADKIGEKAPYVAFATRMSQLKDYYLAFGDCNIPIDGDNVPESGPCVWSHGKLTLRQGQFSDLIDWGFNLTVFERHTIHQNFPPCHYARMNGHIYRAHPIYNVQLKI